MSSNSSNKRDEKAERAIERTIDETKDNTKKVLQDVKRELPEVTATFYDFQQKNINATKEIATAFLESQKEVAKSMFSAFSTPITNNALTLMFYPWMHPQLLADNYITTVSNLADAAVSTVKLSSDLMQTGIDTIGNSVEASKNNVKLISRYMVEVARATDESVSNQRTAR